MDTIKMNLEIQCTDNSRVSVEKLYGYVLRAIAGVVANNDGIVTKMNVEIPINVTSTHIKKENPASADTAVLRNVKIEDPDLAGYGKSGYIQSQVHPTIK